DYYCQSADDNYNNWVF
nr:immunoglobulin light chain junction region [Macaca mulatta]